MTAPGGTALGQGSSKFSDGTTGAGGGAPGGGDRSSTGTARASTPAERRLKQTQFENTLRADFPYQRLFNTFYVEIDLYIIEGHSIPGSDLCIVGDRLRTKESFIISQIVTDYSQCRIVRRGDSEVEICPPGAKTEVVTFDDYLSSPIRYEENACLEYDRSHCRILRRGQENEKEICRVDFAYEGLWATDTLFEYKCTRSEKRTRQHPLQYVIRYMAEYWYKDDYPPEKPVEKYRVTQSIPQCH